MRYCHLTVHAGRAAEQLQQRLHSDIEVDKKGCGPTAAPLQSSILMRLVQQLYWSWLSVLLCPAAGHPERHAAIFQFVFNKAL